jgi:RNA polymerase sigma factor (sigma-70 family)
MDVARLAERAQAGDVDAFTTLVRQYQAMALGYALATTGDRDLAEDAAQQAFITAWRTLGNLRHPERFGGWLRGIVRYECLHLLRARQQPSVPLDAANGIATTDPEPADLVASHATQDDILAAFSALPERERVAATLYYLHDHSQRDVADFLDLPVATINNRVRSARKRLRQEGLSLMANDMFGTSPHFADRIGEVIRAKGAVIDARVDVAQRPPILHQVTIAVPENDATLTAQVAQYLDDDLVRLLPVGDAPVSPGSGAVIRDAGETTSLPMTMETLTRVVGHVRGHARPTAIRETGIKPLDLVCPLGPGAVVAIAGDMRVGKMVLAGELIHRLPDIDPPIAILIFVEATTEALAIQTLDYRTSGSVEAIYLPVADASPEALAPVLEDVDVVIALNRQLGKRGLYPAIDPLRSRSTLLTPKTAGETHVTIVEDIRNLLDHDAHPGRAERLRHYLSNPSYTAEPYTNRPGATVPLTTTLDDVRAILDGGADAIAPETLTMTGALASAGDA